MSDNIRGGGDSDQMKNSLIALQNRKQILIAKFANLKNKNNDLREKIDRKKSRVFSQTDAEKRMFADVSQLSEESLCGKTTIKGIKDIIKERRDSVNRFECETNHRNEEQTKHRDDINSQMNSLTKEFIKLSVDSCSKQKSEQTTQPTEESGHQKEELFKQIKEMESKREALTEELNQLKDGSELLSTHISEELETGNEIKWNDWPIPERIIALEIVCEENQILSEDLEDIKRLSNEELFNANLIQ